jgi:hypothetical protein
MVKPTPLFNPRTIKKFCAKVEVTNAQKRATREWLNLLENNKLEEEKPNYPVFMKIILEEILGYPIKEIEFERDNVEFQFSNSSGKKIVCVEAKGTKTKDLFALQHYGKKEQETPILQTATYMIKNNLDYGICTNYNEFVLIAKQWGLTKVHRFRFDSIQNNEEKLKEFVAIFSKKSIIDNKFVEDLYHKSVIEEREFTKEFYKLFHETRLMLVKEFQSNGNTKDESIHYAQLYLNRLIFMFFAEDNGNIPKRLFPDRVLEILKSPLITEHSKLVSDTILALFESLNKGSAMLNVFGFNGGLFQDSIPPGIYFNDMKDSTFFNDVYQHSELKKEIKLDEDSNNIIKKYHGKLNPVISNLVMMDSFDFNTEVNVNILGHIFEQSLTDLEELKEHEVSKRRKEGIFYTPEYVTDYICRNTIIPYLSKNGATNVNDLIKEYSDSIDELEKRFKEIKILDPACGSGAFLLKAVDILLEIHKEIQTYKESGGEYTFFSKGKKSGLAEQFTLTKWHEEDEARKIIEKNIFGVDINEESVEITKLSLFLKIATTNRKLINLSNNIKIGNSIVSDSNLVDKVAFDWKKEFKDILDNGGFDIVIGNPPYVRQEMLTSIKPHLKENYSVYHGVADLYVYFIEKGLSLLRNNGLFSIIVSNKFAKTSYGENLRNLLLKFNIKTFIDFGDLRVFEDASTYPCILTVQKSKPLDYLYACSLNSLNFFDLGEFVKGKLKKVTISSLGKSGWNFTGSESAQILEKISSNSIKFGSFVNNKFYRGVTTGLDEAFVITEEQKKKIVGVDSKSSEIIFPYLSGKEVKRYRIEWKGNYIIFTRRGIDITKYPAIEKHLNNFRKKLEPRTTTNKEGRKPGNYKWYEIQDVTDYWKIYLSEGIIFPRLNKFSNFTISKINFFPNSSCYQVQNNERWLLAILNSKVIYFYLKSICPYVRGEYYDYRSQYVETIPISSNTKGRTELEKYEKTILENYEEFLKIKNKVRSRILSVFKIDKLNEKIEDFHTISFNEFLTEISKKSDIKLSLKEQDEWEDYFNENKNSLIKLEEEIKKLDYKIDEIVYDMYGINDDEKRIIEDNLK